MAGRAVPVTFTITGQSGRAVTAYDVQHEITTKCPERVMVVGDDSFGAKLAETCTIDLPATTRSVLWLYHVEGYSHPEIAEMVGKTTSFSKSQVARGTARLRDLLEPATESVSCRTRALAI